LADRLHVLLSQSLEDNEETRADHRAAAARSRPYATAGLGLVRALNTVPFGNDDILDQADVKELFGQLQRWLRTGYPGSAGFDVPTTLNDIGRSGCSSLTFLSIAYLTRAPSCTENGPLDTGGNPFYLLIGEEYLERLCLYLNQNHLDEHTDVSYVLRRLKWIITICSIIGDRKAILRADIWDRSKRTMESFQQEPVKTFLKSVRHWNQTKLTSEHMNLVIALARAYNRKERTVSDRDLR
jgi:hypothetical protein